MTPYKLLDWIPQCSIYWSSLSANPRAIRWLEQNLDKINWSELSSNTEAIHILKKNPDKIDWSKLSSNTAVAAIHLLEKNPDKIDWSALSSNSAAVHMLKQNPDKIVWRELSRNTNPDAILLFDNNFSKVKYVDWHNLCKNSNAMFLIDMEWKSTKMVTWFFTWFCCCCSMKVRCMIRWSSLCANTNPAAIRILEENPEKIDWSMLSANSAAIHLIEENPEKIDWSTLSANTAPAAIHRLEQEIRTNSHNNIRRDELSKNPGAIRILETYPDCIDWFQINENSNPEAMRLIEAHWHKHHYISWYMLSKNPNIFTYDYAQMKETKNRLHEELIRNMFHPRNMDKFEGWGIECEWF